MKKVIVAIPHSHTWFWTQTCLSSLLRHPARAADTYAGVVVVDNSPWSPAIRGIEETALADYAASTGCNLSVVQNPKHNKFHASALDHVVETCEFDYLVAMETDVLVARPNWLEWLLEQMRTTDYAVGMWHHEQFVNPSFTLYRGDALRQMRKWCLAHPDPNVLRWGPLFGKTAPLDNNLTLSENPAEILRDVKSWVAGPFAEKRGWPAGSELRETPSGQLKGPGWYEPGQQLHHWAVEQGYTYTVCPTLTTKRADGVPIQTLYGAWGMAEELGRVPPSGRQVDGPRGDDPGRQLDPEELRGWAFAAHLWGGTRALDVLKHPVSDPFIRDNAQFWLAREARFWLRSVPELIRRQTLPLIRQHGWHYRGQGSDHVTERDREAAEYVRNLYQEGGVEW